MHGKASYTVGELAGLAGVSVRTLHLYDQKGLVSPSGRTPAGYRLYGETDLLRLQQVLFYRELDFSLEDIKKALDTPGYDNVAALRRHRRLLELKAERLGTLMGTIDRTIRSLYGEEDMLTNKDLYEGFDDETIERYEREAKASWGGTDAYEQSRRRVKAMSKEQWQAVKARGGEITLAFAGLYKAGKRPDGPEALEVCARWAGHLKAFYDPTPEIIQGLGAMYADHPEFRATYEKYAPGLADWLKPAMAAYAKTM
jgi:MerR family transcriptional regulator, thiopeptide resistance regulator